MLQSKRAKPLTIMIGQYQHIKANYISSSYILSIKYIFTSVWFWVGGVKNVVKRSSGGFTNGEWSRSFLQAACACTLRVGQRVKGTNLVWWSSHARPILDGQKSWPWSQLICAALNSSPPPSSPKSQFWHKQIAFGETKADSRGFLLLILWSEQRLLC